MVWNYLVFYKARKNLAPDSNTEDAWHEKAFNLLRVENLSAVPEGKGHFGFQFDDMREKDPKGKMFFGC